MRKILNTLYLLNENAYLTEENENIIMKVNGEFVGRYPILDIQSIVSFSYIPVSPALLRLCNNKNIQIHFVSQYGQYAGCFQGSQFGSVETLKKQFRISENDNCSLDISKKIILTKALNQEIFLQRLYRNTKLECLKDSCIQIKRHLEELELCKDYKELLGKEGEIASIYFSNWNLFLKNPEFTFTDRNKRPPRDPVNALLSYFYTVLTNEYASALNSAGLNPHVGFLHKDRAGRVSLACDLMEELRAPLVDRFVISQINNKVITKDDFEIDIDNIPILKEKSRRVLLEAWYNRKKEEIEHPYTKEKISISLIPYVQANILNKVIRGELTQYIGFVWR